MANKYVAYAGAYTHEKSNGIHIFDMNVKSGKIVERKEVQIDNPSFIKFSPDFKYLYSICDQGIAAFNIMEDGDLELMNIKSINGMRGCSIEITSDNKFLVVSGYHDGKITVMSINADGSIGVICDEVFHKGMGNIAERNFMPHVTSCVFTKDEEFLCACDSGIDQIKVYKFNHVTGKIKLYDIIRSQLESAPRKMIFNEDGTYAYVICEMKNYINVYKYSNNNNDPDFEFVQNIFTVRRDHKVNSAVTDVIITNGGNNLLCTNAGDNTVTIYDVNKETGMLSTKSSLPVSGNYPKYVTSFPDDKHILCMNNESNTITDFTIHYDKGLIVMNGTELKVSKPNNLIIKKLD